jgi:hypothetical protein
MQNYNEKPPVCLSILIRKRREVDFSTRESNDDYDDDDVDANANSLPETLDP